MPDPLQMIEDMVGGALAKEPLPSPERIRELISGVRSLAFIEDVSDADAEKLALEFEERHGVEMKIGAVLKEADFEPWLDAATAGIDPYYWQRYRRLLSEQGFSSQVLATLDEVTDRILGLLQNPEKEGSWDRRGMVVGHVQSGKTANYTGLISKAADAGYRLIVVIAGVHNNLRNQTQIRIDEGFVGRDSARMLTSSEERIIGVGRYDSSRCPSTFTNSIRDFNKVMASGVGIPLQNLKEPAVFVIKKQANTLKNLLEWLKEHSANRGSGSVDAPMLLIDDEADNASINTKHGSGEVTRINGQIRQLLNMFERSCYIGYTATPFANIFIDPASEDEMFGEPLFPKNFIVSLDPPGNYFGADRVFLEDSEEIIRPIDDNEDRLPLKHLADFVLTALPHSLVTAVRAFLLAKAIRIARGHETAHSSMLVNASFRNSVQAQIRNELHIALEQIQASVRVNGSLPPEQALADPEIRALHDVWSEEYESSTEFDWATVQSKLHQAVAPVRTALINYRSPDTLDYAAHSKTGLSVIAVGGFSLSRGLTLEGLMTSYFLRNSMMYDTLMQMGRWFGYRPGYDDLCRVWMPEEAEGWYAHIAEAIEELREELRVMQAAGATPEQFGLKVRSHPDSLIVTARNKMGSGENFRVKIGLGKSFIETATLRRDEASREANRQAARHFVDQLSQGGKPVSGATQVGGSWLLRDVSPEPVMDFISGFRNHPASIKTEPEPVRRYVEERQDGELAKWDVLFAGIQSDDEKGLRDSSLGMTINCQRRMEGGDRAENRRAGRLPVTNKQRVASRGVEKVGLTEKQIEAVEQHFRTEEGKENFPDRIYREIRERPLLIVHLLAIGDQEDDLSAHKPTVAWSISFPKTEMEDKRVEYVVNTTWWKDNYGDEVDDEEMGGNDD